MKVEKGMVDLYTTAIWSLSVSEVNSVAEERIARLRKKEHYMPPTVIVK